MLLLLPTYKRIDSLILVINSIYNAELPILENNQKPRLIVLNNYPLNSKILNSQIEKIKFSKESSKKWETIIINRPVTLPPVENWYSAVFDNAEKDEIVFFVGDDDPITKDSLIKRYEILKENNATLILGRLVHGLIFSDNCKKYFFSTINEKYDYKINKLRISDLWDWNSVHLSNHCFRFNKVFINSYSNAICWCKEQTIGDLDQRKLFITFYLTIAIHLNDGLILGYDSPVIFRGTSLEELRFSRYTVRSWNLGYISGLAYDLLNNNSLKSISGLREVRGHLLEVYYKYYVALFFDKNITKKARKTLDSAISVKNNFKLSHLLFSVKIVFKYHFRLQALGLSVKNLIFSRKVYSNIDFDDIYFNKKKC
jgi:hypothetical protein